MRYLSALAIVLLFSIATLFHSCSSSTGGGGSNKPGHTGAAWEMVVVINQNYWEGEMGQILRKSLGSVIYGLPQPEPSFKLVAIPQANFGRLYNKHRNLFLIDIDPKYSADGPKLERRKNVWAKGQYVVQVTSPNELGALQVLKEEADQLPVYFTNKELSRIVEYNQKFGNPSAGEKIKKKYGLNMVVPKAMDLALEKDNLFWLWLERDRTQGGYQHQINQGVVVYFEDYQDTTQLSEEYIMQVRDSINGLVVTGSTDDAFMQTFYGDELPPQMLPVDFRGNYAMETRGLWCFCEAASKMGGPFVSLVTVDPVNNRLVFMEGYAYAPQFDKREYLREVEAIIKSVTFEK